MESSSKYTTQLSGNHSRLQTCRSSDWAPGGTYDKFPHICPYPQTYFWVMQMSCSVQKNMTIHASLFRRITAPPVVESTTFVLTCMWWYHSPTSMLTVCCEFWRYIGATDYRSNFAQTILFENCSCFSKIPFSRWNLRGYFSVSFRFLQVTEFGRSTAIYFANSFCQLYSALWSAWQEDPNALLLLLLLLGSPSEIQEFSLS